MGHLQHAVVTDELERERELKRTNISKGKTNVSSVNIHAVLLCYVLSGAYQNTTITLVFVILTQLTEQIPWYLIH